MKNPLLVVVVCATIAQAVDRGLAQQRHLLSEENAPGLRATFSPDGKLLATRRSVEPGSDPALPAPEPGESTVSKVVLWDVNTRQAVRTLYGQAIGHGGRALIFSPDGKTLALAETHGRVRLWNTATWQESTLEVPPSVPLKKPARATSRHPVCGEMAFSPDSSSLAVCYDYGPSAKCAVRLWDHTTYAVKGVLDTDDRLQHVGFLPNGRLALVVMIRGNRTGARELQSWSTESFSRVDRHKLSEEPLYGRFSPDSAVFAAAQHDRIVLYDCKTGRATPLGQYGDYIPNHRVGVTALAFTSDGQSLAAGGEFKQMHTRVKLWDLSPAGRLESRSPLDHGPGRVVLDLKFSPDGRHLATVVRRSTGTAVFLWNLTDAAKNSSD